MKDKIRRSQASVVKRNYFQFPVLSVLCSVLISCGGSPGTSISDADPSSAESSAVANVDTVEVIDPSDEQVTQIMNSRTTDPGDPPPS